MKVAALYDVHAMPWALEAALGEISADAIVFGGDLVGGPCPRETLELARSVDATFVRGNVERELSSGWDRDLLDPADVAWMAGLPVSVSIDGVLYCHATPHDDQPITTAVTPDDALVEMFGATGTFVIGHSHHQFDRTVGELRVVNAGSVGMPYEGEVAAFWLLVDGGEPEFRRTPIDVERASQAILASGWPGAEAFVAENLRVAVDRDEAVRHFESRR